MQLTEVQALFKQDGANYICPIHGDTKGSLSIDSGENRILLHCFAGCTVEDICAHVGITIKDLFYDNYEKTTGSDKFSESLNHYIFGFTSHGKIFNRYHEYRSESGINFLKLIFKQNKEKSFSWWNLTSDKKAEKGELKDAQIYLYNQDDLKDTETVYIVEGEKDAETLKSLGFTAVSHYAGATGSFKNYVEIFRNKNIYIIYDNDNAGKKGAAKTFAIIQKATERVSILNLYDIWINAPEKSDITDYFKEFGEEKTREAICEMTEQAKEKTQAVEQECRNKENLYTRPYILFDENNKPHFNHPIFIDYFENNIKYFIIKNRAYEKANFFIYTDGVYKLCDNDFLKAYIKNILPLEFRKPRILNPLVEDLFYTDKFISYEDCNPENYINFKNGLYNLDTGELENHTPDILTTRQIKAEYDPESDYSKYEGKKFDSFINHFVDGDKSQIQLLLEFIGLIISNIPAYKYKKALFTIGEGDTGKSQLPKLIERLIGSENYYSCKLNKLETSRFDSANLYNKRLASDPDMSFMHVKELELFKVLTGGDPISAEFKGQNGFNFIFDGVMWFCTNKLPQFGGDKGNHVYKRFCIVNAIGKTYLKGETPIDKAVEADPNLLSKMLKEKSYVIHKSLTALKVLIENQRFSETEKQQEALKEYKKTNSSVIQFFEDCIIERPTKDENGEYKIEDTVTRSTIYNAYIKWCLENSEYKERKADLFDYIENQGGDIYILHGYIFFKKYTLSIETKIKYKFFDNTQNI